MEISYDYYLKTFSKGKKPTLQEDLFSYYIAKADRYVTNRISKEDVLLDPKNIEALKNCKCDIAETFFDMEVKTLDKQIASEKVGEYSVTYRDKDVEKVAKQEMKEKLVYWLSYTGLLFRGQR